MSDDTDKEVYVGSTRGRTPALALCIASLRARATT
jgi:hypothetical protein